MARRVIRLACQLAAASQRCDSAAAAGPVIPSPAPKRAPKRKPAPKKSRR